MLVIFVDSDWLVPTVTLPKLRVAGLADTLPAETAVPESGIASDAFEAFDVIVKLPLELPAAVGAKVTVAVVLWDEVSVIGVAMPLTLNPLPLTAASEIVTLPGPAFVKVICCD